LQADCVLHSLVNMKMHGEWQLRNMALTKRSIFYKLSTEDAGEYCRIPLTTIKSIQQGGPYGNSDLEEVDIEIICPKNYSSVAERVGDIVFGESTDHDLVLQFKNLQHQKEWLRQLKTTQTECLLEMRSYQAESPWVKLQQQIRTWYESEVSQWSVCLLIVANFATNVAEAQIRPVDGSKTASNFGTIDDCFTILFTIELIFNLAANLWTRFWMSAWNVFDLVVVVTSIQGMVQGGGDMSVLRVIRALRVFRLFRRVESLRKVLQALGGSVLPVSNAFLILLLFSMIYAILGVTFFAEDFPVYFGDFSKSLFTIFQVLTGDSWAHEIARPIMDLYGGGATATFFVSYLIVGEMVLIQVMVAILLEEFAKAGQISALEHFKRGGSIAQEAIYEQIRPLLGMDNEDEQAEQISNLWYRMDTNQNGVLEMAELAIALNLMVPSEYSGEDFQKELVDQFTQRGSFCTNNGNMTFQGFTEALQFHLGKYSVTANKDESSTQKLQGLPSTGATEDLSQQMHWAVESLSTRSASIAT